MRTTTVKSIFLMTFLSVAFQFAPVAVGDIIYRNRPAEQHQDNDVLFRVVAKATDAYANDVIHSFRDEGQGRFVTNDNTRQNFRVFGGDVYTNFAQEGKVFNATSLDSEEMTLYTEKQKEQLNSLFSHVYTSAFDSKGEMLPGLEAQLFQFAVWEIIHETSDHLSILGGSFYATDVAWWDYHGEGSGEWGYGFAINDPLFWNNSQLPEDAVLGHSQLAKSVNLLQTWFSAIENNSWESTDYSVSTAFELTVYVDIDGTSASQTLISTVAPVAPEPASLLIFGIGSVVLLPFLRRKKR